MRTSLQSYHYHTLVRRTYKNRSLSESTDNNGNFNACFKLSLLIFPLNFGYRLELQQPSSQYDTYADSEMMSGRQCYSPSLQNVSSGWGELPSPKPTDLDCGSECWGVPPDDLEKKRGGREEGRTSHSSSYTSHANSSK